MMSLLFTLAALAANPCPRAYVPGAQSGNFLEQRMEKNGVKLSKPEAWKDFVKSENLESETKDFDQVDQDVFLRRLEELSLKELKRLYSGISETKLKNAKAKVNPCVK